MFRDITTLLADAEGFKYIIQTLAKRYREQGVDHIVGIEARGFILGAALAYELGVGFVPIRKQGKLPGEVIGENYQLEYGTDRVEIHKDALSPNQQVILIDDLLATGGTALGGLKLVEAIGARVLECAFVIDLPDLKGREKLESAGHKIFTMIEFDGD